MALFSKTLIGDVGSAVLNEAAHQLNTSLCNEPTLAVFGLDLATSGVGVGGAGFQVGLGRFDEDVLVSRVSFAVIDQNPPSAILSDVGSYIGLSYTDSTTPGDYTAGTVVLLWGFLGNGNPLGTFPVNETIEGRALTTVAAPATPLPNPNNTYSDWVIPAGNELYLEYIPLNADEVVVAVGAHTLMSVSVHYRPMKDLIVPSQNYKQTMRSWSSRPRS